MQISLSKPLRITAAAGRLALIAAGLTLVLPQAAYPWAQNGHRAVGEIAERHLEPEIRDRIRQLLDGRSLAEVSNWADDIRSFTEWDCAQSLHFVTIQPGADYPGDGAPQGDAIKAVVFYTDVLKDRDTSMEARATALKFLVHFVGDLHQPLHAGRGCDRGGNHIKVEWFGETVSLHSVWDEKLIESENLSFTELVDFADHATAAEIAAYQDSTPIDWAHDAQVLLDEVYTCNTTGDRCPCFCGGCEDGLSPFGGCLERPCTLIAAGPVRMGYHYKTRTMPLIYTQLVKGGARLAGMLNWIFADSATPPKIYRDFHATMHGLPEWPAASEAMTTCDGSGEPLGPSTP